MDILYSTNDHYYSKLHRWIEGVDCTHVGLLFFKGDLDIVLDCTKPFSKIYHLRQWEQKYTISKRHVFHQTEEEEKEYYHKCVDYCLLKPYDWGAYFFAWIVGLRKKIFGIDYPRTNKMKTDGLWCTEVIRPIVFDLGFDFGIDLGDVDLAALSPHMLYEIIKEYEYIVEE